MTVILGTSERVGHRANAVDTDYESDASRSSGPGLTDSSSEDETVATGGRARRIVTPALQNSNCYLLLDLA